MFKAGQSAIWFSIQWKVDLLFHMDNHDDALIVDDSGSSRSYAWLDLPELVRVELGPKEVPDDLIESALSGSDKRTWRAIESGPQTIRLRFAAPQCIRRIRLVFEEQQRERTQEFVLSWLQQGAAEDREIVRQQYVFSPQGSNRETEEYEVELKKLVAIKLYLIPDLSDKKACASLTQWSLATGSVG